MIGFLAVCAVGAMVWMACDKIPDGEMRGEPTKIPPYVEEDAKIDENLQYVVLEDFTGVRCINCPKAAEVAHALQGKLKNQLIVIGSHPSGSALTKPYTGDADLRSETAQIYHEYWKQPGLPAGLINRRQEPGKTLVHGNWTAEADAVAAEKPVATVNQVNATIASGKIAVEASGYFKSDYTQEGDINLILLVLEDGFLVRQEGDEESKEQHNYAHNHVLRTSIGDAWGVKVLDAKPAAETKFTYTATVELNADWKTDKLAVVAMLTNATTREIINAAKVKVK